MALLIDASGESISVAAASSINDLSTWTMLMWIYRTATPIASGRRLFGKGPSGTQETQMAFSGTAGDIRIARVRSVTTTQYITNTTPLATNDKWYLVGGTFDSGGAAGQVCNIYVGDLTKQANEESYGTTTDGSGTLNTDASASLVLGNNVVSPGTSFIGGRIAYAAFFNRVLTQTEIQSWQYNPRSTISGCVGFWVPGFNGTTNVPDWSGNGNTGTITGATVANHVPLGPTWRGGLEEMPYVVSAGGATTRGIPFGNRGTAFNGGRTFQGIIHA